MLAGRIGIFAASISAGGDLLNLFFEERQKVAVRKKS
jgi:hypothetical protein